MSLYCPDCGSDHVTFTGCPAANCPGQSYCCIYCAWGCTQLEHGGGECEAELMEEGPDAVHERLNDEREAYGLSRLPQPREGEQ